MDMDREQAPVSLPAEPLPLPARTAAEQGLPPVSKAGIRWLLGVAALLASLLLVDALRGMINLLR
jgi:hypothetical protein